jgi:hypothetical protein
LLRSGVRPRDHRSRAAKHDAASAIDEIRSRRAEFDFNQPAIV